MGKSSELEMKNRGYIQENDLFIYRSLGLSELMELLNSISAFERTIAVRLISNLMKDDEHKAVLLCERLSNENKLYTKIELCEALRKMGTSAAKIMCMYLGKIGNNQYKELPAQEFKKKSYPLPRDIISRTLAHMGREILPYLIEVLKSKDTQAIREGIDAIGFICFYDSIDYPLEHLANCFNINNDDMIIRWKVARALGYFNSVDSTDLLVRIHNFDGEERIKKEAQRSLKIIQQRKTATL